MPCAVEKYDRMWSDGDLSPTHALVSTGLREVTHRNR